MGEAAQMEFVEVEVTLPLTLPDPNLNRSTNPDHHPDHHPNQVQLQREYEQALAAHESLAPPTSTSFKIALHDPALVQRLLRLPAHGFKAVEWHGSRVKVAPRQGPCSAPVLRQGASGGSKQLGTPGKRPAHWAPSHCLGCSS